MKQHFLLMISMIFFTSINAQITIQSSDVIDIGFVADQTTDTLPDPSILEGGVGNINWDFSILKPGEDGQYVFLDPTSTPYFSSFPEANLASRVETELYAYMVKDNDKIEIIGVEGTLDVLGFPIQGKLDVTPGQSLIRFPATFGDTYDETVVQQGQVPGSSVGLPTIDSIRVVNTVERAVDIDAWGEMTIPAGVFNTIRSSETETTSSQVYFYSSGVWIPQGAPQVETLVYYNWWTIDDDGLAFPVVQMVYDPASASRTVTYLESLTAVTNIFTTEATLYPNPAKDYLNIDFDEPFTGKVEVFNLSGQKQLTMQLANSYSAKINLASCSTGFHIILLKGINNDLAGFKKFEIFR